MNSPYEKYLLRSPETLDDRVELILDAVRYSVSRQYGDDVNEANVRLLEAFFTFLEERFPAGRFQTEIQPIPKRRIRTTDRNFVVTVNGRSAERIVLVAHYDTWAGLSREAPGADDNTTGEEVLKHYVLRDLAADEPPELTHVYLFAGSEECGMRGLISQLGLTAGLMVVGFALSMGNPLTLVFNQFELIAMLVATLIAGLVSLDGESNWLEGAMLLAIYIIIALAFFWLPT